MSKETEQTEETAPAPTLEELTVEAAGMSAADLKERYNAEVANLGELKGVELKTLDNVKAQKETSERAKIWRAAYDQVATFDEIELQEIAEEQPAVTEQDTGSAEAVEDQPEATPEQPAEDVDATRELVAASAGGASAPTLAVGEPDQILQPFEMTATTSGAPIRSLQELGKAFMLADGSKAETWVGSFKPYGQNVTAAALTENALENAHTIYGDDTRRMFDVQRGKRSGVAPSSRTSITSALNCTGPAQAVQEIPFCFTGGRPLEDSGLIATMEATNGQIQLYDCHQLPEVEGLLNEAADCEDCNAPCDDLVCASHECLQPAEPMVPKPIVTCMCIPESLQFSSPFMLERALEDFAYLNDVAYETMWLEQLRALSVIREVDGSANPAHGAWSTILNAINTVKSRLALDARCTNGIEDYSAFIPGGEALFCAAMADKMNRVVGCECPGEDLLAQLESMGLPVVFGLDQDANGPAVAEGFTAVWDDPTPGVPAPLERMVNAGSVFLIPRDTLATASPLQTELGLDDRSKCEVANGCLKMVRREWWFDLFNVGCRTPVVLDFTALGTCGTGPDLTACP